MPIDYQGDLTAGENRFAIVVSRFNNEITDRLLEGALQALAACGVNIDEVPVAHVPGSLELAVVAKSLAITGQYDAVICLGCVIRGETTHYDCVAMGAVHAITAAAAETGVPIMFGVLTTEDDDQALARSDAARKTNMGADVARGAVEMANLMNAIANPS
ncbi:MAG: 6,7-dimethyl-8-ribityllumazine synthase [Planctomycetes bacterium]|nr:6,7-dimethyl-8-ribityllumazine synthase [Planctomycetota bacterium]